MYSEVNNIILSLLREKKRRELFEEDVVRILKENFIQVDKDAYRLIDSPLVQDIYITVANAMGMPYNQVEFRRKVNKIVLKTFDVRRHSRSSTNWYKGLARKTPS
jgi:hypothetical protein